MNIQGIGGFGLASGNSETQKTGQNLPGGGFAGILASLGDVPEKTTAEEFLAFMKKTPEEKMMYLWLQSHGISEEEFEALAPAEKQKLIEQMKAEIREQIENNKAAAIL